MPIRFEQPSPMAPQTSIEGGRAQVATHDFPSIVSMYDAANRNQLAAATASAQLQQQGSAHSAQIMAQSAERGAALAQQQQQFESSREVSPRDQYLAGVQRQSVQEHAQAQAWVHQQALSQQEEIHLQRLMGAVGTINEARAKGELSDEEADAAILRVKSPVDIYHQRQEAARAKQEQAMTAKVMHANAQAVQMENMDQGERAKYVQSRAFSRTDPETGEVERDENGRPVQYVLDQHGVPHVWNQHGGKATKDAATAEHDLPMKESEWHTHYDKLYDRTEAAVTKQEEERIAQLGLKKEQIDPEEVQRRTEEKMRKLGLGNTYSEYRANYSARRHPPQPPPPGQQPPQPQQGPGQQQGPPPIQPIPGALPPPQAQEKLQDVEGAEKPFSLNDHSTMAPWQSLAMKDLGDFRAKAGSPEVVQAVDLTANFFANYGTLNQEKLQKRGATPAQLEALKQAKELIRRTKATMTERRPFTIGGSAEAGPMPQ